MYGELASIRRTIGLSPQEALDSAKTFLTQRGYHVVQRKKHSLAVERHRPGQAAGAAQDAPKLTVLAGFQPGGGVRIRVRGNDPKGVQERQAECVEWSEALPKEQEARTDEPEFRASVPDKAQGAFVTTGGYTGKARGEAEREGFKRIGLIDGGQLVDILTEEYDRLPQEVREKLGLRWVLVAG